MSTRCEVIIKQNLGKGNLKIVKLYHHHDGYPEGVGVDLVKRSKVWHWDIDSITNTLIKDTNDEYEFTAYKHTDIDYAYIIDCDKRIIRCFSAIYVFNQTEEETLLNFEKEVKIPQGKEVL